MKKMMTKSLNKLFFAISIVVVLSFTVGSIDARESSLIIKQEDAATAIANTCAALIESCARQPELCIVTETSPSTLLVDIYNEAAADIMALNLESAPNDIALAKGILKASLITALARQPELQGDLEELEALCNEDIETL